MALTGSNTEQKIWNFLKAKGINDYGAAGLMGNLQAESALRPENLQNTYEKSLGFTDSAYTAAVDNGSYTNFVRDSAGYGLAQWTYWSRKQGLLDYARAAGASIGDLEMQLGFLFKELSEGYKAVLATLKTATSVLEASNAVLLKFERPANQGSSVQAARAKYGQAYYDKYAEQTTGEKPGGQTTTEKQLRQKVVDIATKYIGCKESDGSHRKIVDIYNSHKPYARGYKMTYTGAWCSTFASAVAIEAGLTSVIPTEVGCERHIELFKAMGSWEENDAYVPSPGDYVFYDYDDKADYANTDNKGWSDHVGIVASVSGKNITTIEGNVSDSVAYRKLTVNGKNIRGYGVPKYGSLTGTEPYVPDKPEPQPEPGAETVYTVVAGDTLSKIASKYGTTYQALAAYNGISNPNIIRVGQIIKIPSGTSGTPTAPAPSKPAEPTYDTYTVVKGDNLWSIASRKLGKGSRYPEIKKLNGLKSNTIYAGQVLKLPAR